MGKYSCLIISPGPRLEFSLRAELYERNSESLRRDCRRRQIAILGFQRGAQRLGTAAARRWEFGRMPSRHPRQLACGFALDEWDAERLGRRRVCCKVTVLDLERGRPRIEHCRVDAAVVSPLRDRVHEPDHLGRTVPRRR
eukprot:4984506-Prymnesium_polylepis.1